jgi:peptidoglycan/LPS O-acetylase OafA/YrhL
VATSKAEPPTMPENLKPLTALRFFAAMWVVSFHYWHDLVGKAAALPNLVSKGYLGVELFFVLSGFILSHVYLDGLGQGRFKYGKFLWARLARVYPLHIAVLAGVGLLVAGAAAAGFELSHNIADWAALPANLTLTHAWGLAPEAAWNHPSWSISAEWFAYLTFPLFGWAAWRMRRRPGLAVAGAIALLTGLYLAFQAAAGFPLTQATIHWGALRIVPCFAYGCAINLMWRSGAVRTSGQALAGALAFTALTIASAQLNLHDALTVSLFGGVILSLAALSSTGSKVLSGPVGVYLGEVSYAVYMVCIPWQLVYVNAAEKLLHLDGQPLPFVVWLGLVAGVVPVAMAGHHLVERPCRTAMRAWADRGFSFAARGEPSRTPA